MIKINRVRKDQEIAQWEKNALHDLECEYQCKKANVKLAYAVVEALYADGVTPIPLDASQVLKDLRKVNPCLDTASKYAVLMEMYRKQFRKESVQ